MVPAKEQLKIMMKGVLSVVSEEELLQKLQKSCENETPLTIKLGLDPSAPDIHLGHAVVLRKIKQMQDLGHRAVIVIGDFTGRIGDPTGKSKGRIALSEETVKANAATYCDQMFKILDRSKTSVRFNSEWLAQLRFEEILRLAATTTVARMLERDDFQTRYRNQTPIGVHEFLYPLMQAYDSVELHADIELGGTDQTFNVLMGRSLQKSSGQEEQITMFMPLLVGLDGVEKMSKSLGNYIGVDEPAEVMFKKVMEIPDSLIVEYYELTTDEHPDTIDRVKRELENGRNPRDIKLELAEIITSLYHSSEDVRSAKEYYQAAFGKKAIPDQIPELHITVKDAKLSSIVSLLIENAYVPSKSELLRLIKQGGVQKNTEKLTMEQFDEPLLDGDVIKIGKKKFVKICFS